MITPGFRKSLASLVTPLLPLVLLLPLRGEEEAPQPRDFEKEFKTAFLTKDLGRLKRLVAEVAERDDAATAALLIDYTLSGLDYDLELRAGRTLAAMTDPEARALMWREATGNKDYKTRIVLLGVAYYQYRRDVPEAFQVLVNSVVDTRKEVVLAGLMWLKKTGDTRAVDALIESLAKWEKARWGRIYFDIRNTLRELTGSDFDIADDWRNWWEARKQGIAAPPPSKDGRTKVVSRKFFSVSIDSDRVVFIIDVSGSMEKKDPPQEKEEKEKKGKTFVASRKKKEKKKIDPATLPIERQRLFRVKQELIRTIESLPESIFFTVQSFSHQIRFLGDSATLVQATPVNKKRAIDWVNAMRPEGETYTDVAFERAFEEVEGMDTIIFLSDGAPRRNDEPIPEELVLGRIKEANRFAKCRVHAIGFEQAGSNLRRFLQTLARQNDGTFTQLE